MTEQGSIIYLDNGATTKPFDEAVEAALWAMREDYFNPSSAYAQALSVSKKIQRARENVAALMGLPAAGVVFTGGGTEGDNLALLGSVTAARAGKKHIIISAIEHSAVSETAHFLSKQGHDVDLVPVDVSGRVTCEALTERLRPDTFLVSIMHVNNETGAVNDLAALGRLVHEVSPQALFHADGVQALGRVALDGAQSEIDLYTVSGHKINATKGVGALYIRKGVRLVGMQLGGGQEGGLRSGTENVPGILAFGAAAERYLKNKQQYVDHMFALKQRLWNGLCESVEGVIINGPHADAGAPHILNVSFTGVRSEVLLHALEGEGVLVGMGSACSSRRVKISVVLRAMGLDTERAQGAIRFSFSPLNTEEEIDAVLPIIKRQVELLRRYQRR